MGGFIKLWEELVNVRQTLVTFSEETRRPVLHLAKHLGGASP